MKERYYFGEELALFETAFRWKRYWAQLVRPYISGHVLEVGAGTGGTTKYIYTSDCNSWLCLEPDQYLVNELRRQKTIGQWQKCRIRRAVISQLEPGPSFDTILYIDVLEHIQDDARQVAEAVSRLRPGGHLIILSPAHQWLISPFDKRIGHFRRYSRRSLATVVGENLHLITIRYIDSWGILASLANRLLLREALPTAQQVRIWNKWLVPLSRPTDMLLRYSVGKSVLGIWQKPHS